MAFAIIYANGPGNPAVSSVLNDSGQFATGADQPDHSDRRADQWNGPATFNQPTLFGLATFSAGAIPAPLTINLGSDAPTICPPFGRRAGAFAYRFSGRVTASGRAFVGGGVPAVSQYGSERLVVNGFSLPTMSQMVQMQACSLCPVRVWESAWCRTRF
jgi:hypothetical protein